MKQLIYFSAFILLAFTACENSPKIHEENNLTSAEKIEQDSLSRVDQKRVTDSLKQLNPLLILPPDSVYTGDYTDKYPSGLTKFKGFFRFGQRHGQWMSFYPNGALWSEMHYDKGLRHGPNMTYFIDGKPRYSGFYKNDEKDSLWVFYDSLGVVAERAMYKNGRMVKNLPLK